MHDTYYIHYIYLYIYILYINFMLHRCITCLLCICTHGTLNPQGCCQCISSLEPLIEMSDRSTPDVSGSPVAESHDGDTDPDSETTSSSDSSPESGATSSSSSETGHAASPHHEDDISDDDDGDLDMGKTQKKVRHQV